MKTVGIRETQMKLTSLLKDLPFAIKRYNKIVAIVDRKEDKVPKYKFSPKSTFDKEMKQAEKGDLIKPEPKEEPEQKIEEKALKDERLDRIVPLMVDILSRLLGSAGMLRYRKDFIEKVKEIMDEKKDSIKG